MRRAEAGAPRQARERTARVRVCTCSMRTGLARACAAAGPTESCALHAWLPVGPVGTPVVGGLVSLGSKRLVTKLIAGWIVVPAL